MDAIVLKISRYSLKKLESEGAQDVVVTASSGKVQQIKFVNSKIISTNDYFRTDTQLFASFGKRIISANLENYTEENADKIIKHMKEVSNHVSPKDDYNGIAEGPFEYSKHKFDSLIKEPGVRGVEICEDGIKAAMDAGAKRVAGQLQLECHDVSILTSGGVDAASESSSAYYSVRALTDKDASGAKTSCALKLKNLDAVTVSREAGELAVRSTNPKQGKPGRYDIVFDSLPFEELLNNVADAASIFSVESGGSFFEGKLGQKVAGDNITVYDDATKLIGLNSTPFDSEGAPTRRNEIIERGVLKNYLHNTSTAKKYGVQTTANAGLVAPHPWNIVLDDGNKSFDEMLLQVKKGLWITNIWYTRFQNYLTGEFSTIPRDAIFLIENGKITKPVVNIRIADSFLRMLENIAVVGNDVKQIKSWEADMPTFTPSVLVKDVEITSPMK